MGQDGVPGTANALIGRDASGMSIGYYGDEDYKAIDAARWGTSPERSFAPVGGSGTLAAARWRRHTTRCTTATLPTR